jgi:hypothetical protein
MLLIRHLLNWLKLDMLLKHNTPALLVSNTNHLSTAAAASAAAAMSCARSGA